MCVLLDTQAGELIAMVFKMDIVIIEGKSLFVIHVFK